MPLSPSGRCVPRRAQGKPAELRDRRLRDRDRRSRRLPRPPRPRAATPDPGARAKRLVRPSSHGPARISRLTLRVAAGTSGQPASHGPSCSFGTSFPENRSRDSARETMFRPSSEERPFERLLAPPLASARHSRRQPFRCTHRSDLVFVLRSSGACHGYARFCGVCSAEGSRVLNRRCIPPTGHVRGRVDDAQRAGTPSRRSAPFLGESRHRSRLACGLLGRTANNNPHPPMEFVGGPRSGWPA